MNVDVAYNLPIYLRNFYYKLLQDAKDNEAKQYEKASAANKAPVKR
jgi:hypothetical protein